MLHLYCIVPRGRAVPESCIGLDGRRPFPVESGDLALWATEHDRAMHASVDAVRIHNQVVLAAMDTAVTPVPVRFGQTAPDMAAAADRMADDADRWLAQLARFAGRAEYGVRAVTERTDAEQDVHAASAASGTEYMTTLARKRAHLAERRAHAERIVHRIEAAGALADETAVEHSASGPVLVAVAHLVAWTAAEAYHGAMREVRGASADTRLILSGPWPPWSFVE